jgi:hypothetical protein
MADINNKLRLQIVTQLDAAGIKATKEQVDQLELGLRRAGNSSQEAGGKFGQLEKALGKMPGPLGKIGETLGGLAGKASLVIGAFSMGVEIGNKIYENVVGPLQDWVYGTKELEKAEANYEQSLKRLQSTLDDTLKVEKERLDAMGAASERAIKAIDNETAAYFRQAAALEGIKKAQGNAEMLRLQGAKFDDMQAYAAGGNAEAAEQVGKYYDVLMAELAAKQQLEEFDRNSVKLAKDLESAESAYAIATERAAAAKSKQEQAEAALASHRAAKGIGGNAMYDNIADEAIDNQLEAVAKKARAEAEKAAALVEKRGERLENVDAEVLTRQMERANLAYGGRLSVDRAAQAYDDYVMSAGNPLNADVDPQWAKDLLQKTVEADQVQRDILTEVKAFGDRLEKLLEIK